MGLGKETYDTRGKQRNVLRLLHFDDEGLAHMITYRILAILSIITGIMIFVALYMPQAQWLMSLAEALIAIVWLLFGVELWSTYKAMGIISTKGIVFGRLNKSFLDSEAKMKGWYSLARPAGYALLIIWYALFVAFVWVVFI